MVAITGSKFINDLRVSFTKGALSPGKISLSMHPADHSEFDECFPFNLKLFASMDQISGEYFLIKLSEQYFYNKTTKSSIRYIGQLTQKSVGFWDDSIDCKDNNLVVPVLVKNLEREDRIIVRIVPNFDGEGEELPELNDYIIKQFEDKVGVLTDSAYRHPQLDQYMKAKEQLTSEPTLACQEPTNTTEQADVVALTIDASFSPDKISNLVLTAERLGRPYVFV